MGIDRVGKGGATPPTAGTPAPTTAKETGKVFEAQKPASADAVSKAGPSPIEQLRAGTIDANGYLDLKVKEATGHLGALSPAQLDVLRSVLRDQIASDPTLASLFEKATGTAPPQPADE